QMRRRLTWKLHVISRHWTQSASWPREAIMRAVRMFGPAALVAAMVLSVAPARAADTVVFGTIGSASANLWPWFIGLDKGLFAAENVKLAVVSVRASAGVIQQLAAGSLEMTDTGLVDPIRAIEQGAALALVALDLVAPPYVMMAKPAIKSLAELKGKVISIGGAKD